MVFHNASAARPCETASDATGRPRYNASRMSISPVPSLLAVLVAVACGPSSPCRSGDTIRKLERFSAPYAGHWVVARGDTLTLPDPSLADRFKLTDILLETNTVDRKSTRLNSSHPVLSRMPSSA